MILNRIDLAESRIIGAIRPVHTAPQSPPRLRPEIPQPVQALLVFLARGRFGGLENISIVPGVDETVFHLDRATQWHIRRECRGSHAFRLASIMTAYWILEMTKAGIEYQRIAATPVIPSDELDEQLLRWGMTTTRFVAQLADVRINQGLFDALQVQC